MEQIANQNDLDNLQKVVDSKIYISAGTATNGSTIPLPSGYSRKQCRYAVWCEGSSYYQRFDNYETNYITISWSFTSKVNQNTGVVSGNVGYLVIAVK